MFYFFVPKICQSQLIFIGMSLSILSRLFYLYVLIKNKSKNPFSLTVCSLTLSANAFWIPYAISIKSHAVFFRSTADIFISSCGVIIISYNIYKYRRNESIK